MNDEQTSGATATVVLGTQPLEPTEEQRRLALGLISGCHTLNHLQYSITSVIFPVMMKELGFGLFQLGFISALSSFVGQGLQVMYGFFSGLFKRTTLLGVRQCHRGRHGDVAMFRPQLPGGAGCTGGDRCWFQSTASPRLQHPVALLFQSPWLGV